MSGSLRKASRNETELKYWMKKEKKCRNIFGRIYQESYTMKEKTFPYYAIIYTLSTENWN